MKQFFDGITLNKIFIENFDIAETFASKSKSIAIELSDGLIKTSNALISGTSVRAMKNSNPLMFINHGEPKTDTDNWFYESQKNKTPPFLLPNKKIIQTSTITLPIVKYLSDYTVRSLYDKYYILFKDINIRLNKIMLEQNISGFKLANTYGIEGYGYNLFYCLSMELQDQKGCEQTLVNLNDTIDFDKSVSKILTEYRNATTKKSSEVSISFNDVILTSKAFFEVIYLLLFFLCDKSLILGPTFISNNVNRLNEVLKISDEITIEENSLQNALIGGICDGEGSERISNLIFDNGNFNHLLSSFSATAGSKTYGSAYRFSYNILPQTKASKISVRINRRNRNILDYDLVGVIDSFQGIFESINKETFDFTALLSVKIYKYGKHIGYKSLKIQSNLIKVLSSVYESCDDSRYIGDGTIRVPAVIARYQDWL